MEREKPITEISEKIRRIKAASNGSLEDLLGVFHLFPEVDDTLKKLLREIRSVPKSDMDFALAREVSSLDTEFLGLVREFIDQM